MVLPVNVFTNICIVLILLASIAAPINYLAAGVKVF